MKLFKWLRGSPHLTLRSELSPVEFAIAIERSAERLSYVPWANLFKTGRMLGRLENGNGFKLQERLVIPSSDIPTFRGQFTSAGSGTEISGYFSVSLLSTVFMIVWLSLAFLITGFLFLSAAIPAFSGDGDHFWMAIAGFSAMLLVSFAALFSSVIGKKREAKFVRYFKENFDATLIDRRE